jgi:predicted ArsR family transcriptional regulator
VAGRRDLGNITVVKNVGLGEDPRTRGLVARAILEGGPATAIDLASRLEITPAGVRRHLDSLVNEGVLQAREPHLSSLAGRGRGRPAKVFVMTDDGREKFEHSYDDLAVMAIRFMSTRLGEGVVTEFARYRADDLERRSISPSNSPSKNSIKNHGENKSNRITSLAKFLTKDGYAATVHRRNLGDEICQHHCPIAHVAAEYPQICEAETEAFARILGTHVQRLATIAHGDGVCTTFIPDIDLVRGSRNPKKSLRSSKDARTGKVSRVLERANSRSTINRPTINRPTIKSGTTKRTRGKVTKP